MLQKAMVSVQALSDEPYHIIKMAIEEDLPQSPKRPLWQDLDKKNAFKKS